MKRFSHFATWLVGAVLVSACSGVGSEESEAVGTARSAIVGVDTWAYLRCNATGWNVDDVTRLKPTANPNQFTVDFDVTQDWIVQSNDGCIITVTDQLNGWGTTSSARSLTPRIVAPGTTAQLVSSWDYFFVDYAETGAYRATVDFAANTVLIAPATAVVTPDLVETNILGHWTAASSDVASNQLSLLGPAGIVNGQAALRATTTSGFDFWLRYEADAPIDASQKTHLGAAIRALNTTPIGWQINGPLIVLEDESGQRLTLSPESQYLPSDGAAWTELRAPLSGDSLWTASGSTDLQHITAIELHADTWDSGFTIDLDNVRFTSLFDTCAGAPLALGVAGTTTATTATLSYSAATGAVGYNIYRGIAGATPTFLTRARGTEFVDSGLPAGGSVQYEVRPVAVSGCEAGNGEVTLQTQASSSTLLKTPSLKVLVPIYRGGEYPYTAEEITGIEASLNWSRLFYYRNSQAKLNLAFDFMEIDAGAPDTSNAYLGNVEADLRARGIIDDQYDAVYVVARDLGGCYGGFQLLGHTAGAFGTACGVPFPSNDPNVDATMAWVFTHEFQHAFDFVIASGSGADVIHGHPDAVYEGGAYEGPFVDAGEHYDWEGATLRAFTGYTTLAAPHDKYLESVDSDGDGLADSDARLPTDEARFGSNPNAVDSDADGLGDLGEFTAGVYAGSKPAVADTDGDGQLDGVDPTPRAGIASSIGALTAAIDGVRDAGYTLFRNGFEFTQVAGFNAATYLGYDADYLYVLAETSMAASLVLYVDGSGPNGFWQGDDTYAISLSPNAEAPLNHTVFHGTGGDGVTMPGGQLVTRVIGSTTVLEARIPRSGIGQGFGWTGAVTDGFSTAEGSVLGMRIWFSRIGGVGGLQEEPWAIQNELFHFDDVTLD